MIFIQLYFITRMHKLRLQLYSKDKEEMLGNATDYDIFGFIILGHSVFDLLPEFQYALFWWDCLFGNMQVKMQTLVLWNYEWCVCVHAVWWFAKWSWINAQMPQTSKAFANCFLFSNNWIILIVFSPIAQKSLSRLIKCFLVHSYFLGESNHRNSSKPVTGFCFSLSIIEYKHVSSKKPSKKLK